MQFIEMCEKHLERSDRNIGYALFRVFIGSMFIMHGYDKVFGGLAGFTQSIGHMGVPMLASLAPIAAYAEFAGGILLIFGLFTRIAAFLICCNMVVAFFIALASVPFQKKELALVYLVACFMFIVKGSGKYSLDYLMLTALKCFKKKT
jgi:putative oxidoreductase